MARWNNLVHFGIFQFSRNFSTLFVFHFLEFFLFFHWTAQIFQSFCVFAPDFESLIGQAININLQKKFFFSVIFAQISNYLSPILKTSALFRSSILTNFTNFSQQNSHYKSDSFYTRFQYHSKTRDLKIL